LAKEIKNVAVVGAGVMGAQIAGHLANCGYPVLLLDISDEIVSKALDRLVKSSPPALFSKRVLKLIETGNIKDHLDKALERDWIIEVVPEKLEIKRELYERIEKGLQKKTIVTSNTSGISLSILTEGRSSKFKKSFLITHFFNPVRYMKLVELVKGPATSKKNFQAINDFLTEKMGKGMVIAKDTPGFIANRIGIFSVMNAMDKTIKNGWPVDLVDAVMSLPVSFARSGIFRTTDIVGLDTLLYVAKNSYELCQNDPCRDVLLPDPKVEKMFKEGRLGVKSGAGFYKKEAGKILVLDPATDQYREKQRYSFDSLKQSRKVQDPAERLNAIYNADDDAGRIAHELISDLLKYVSSVADEISDSHLDIDNAMKWGYNWELGPFEMQRAIESKEGGKVQVPVLKKGSLNGFNKLAENAGASLLDVGDGVLCAEFHAKMNAIDPDIIAMLNQGVDLLDAGKYSGMIIYNDAPDFSVGANLLMIAMAIGSGSWQQLEDLVKAFQDVGQRMRFSQRPVVAVPFGKALGGGCEVCLAAGNNVVAAESYMGLVELGVGLIPAGGGCKNLLINMEERRKRQANPKDRIWFSSKDGGSFPKVTDAFETIAMAKVSVSGMNAKDLGYISEDSKTVLDRDKVFEVARQTVLELSKKYLPPKMREDIRLPGRGGEMALIGHAEQLKALGQISEYDVQLASGLAHILCGGNVSTDHFATEQDILDLEREVFLKLCGNEKTAERIQHILTAGKPLRN
jgi:3-hydroxyacyl-CoA dehydrogenase